MNPVPPPRDRTKPIFPGLIERRFLIARSKNGRAISLVWVDDDGSCDRPEIHEHDPEDDTIFRKDWHTYQQWDRKLQAWMLYAYRCPASLSFTERQNLEKDIPIGHAEGRLRSERENRDRGTKAETVMLMLSLLGLH